MLFILTSNNIINILVISVRYFGGIKLGTGGLFKSLHKWSIGIS